MGVDGDFSGFFRKLWMLIRRGRFRSELDEEMAFHRTQAAKEFVAEGMTPKAARMAAKKQFGNAVRLKERSQEVVGFSAESVAQDLRFALRQLRKNPGFALTAIAIMALGIGASVAIFGFVDATLIKPLPFQDPARLAMLFESNTLGPRFHLSYPDYLDWKRMNTTFSELDVFGPYGFILKTPDGMQQADGARVSAGFFRTLGVTPALGRDFYANEDSVAAQHVVLLSFSAWQTRFGGQKNVLGQSVTLDGETTLIVGVLPATFHFAPAEPAEFWKLIQPGPHEQQRGSHGLFGVGRLKDGVSFPMALADIKAVARQLERQYPDANRDRLGLILPLVEVIVGDIRPILLVLLGGTGLLLLIATVNVASLLLVRSESRKREIAVRGALGASQARLMRQFVTEGLLLSAAGSAAGMACGVETMRLLTHLMPKDMLAKMPFLLEFGFNARVAAFAACICVVTGLLFAITPIFRLSVADMREGLTEGGRSSAGTLWRRFGANLVVIEIATAMVLLVGAGLLGKSLYRLLHADSGLQADHVATLQGQATGDKYDKDERLVALERQIESRIGSLPGVKSVGVTSSLPLGDGDGITDFHVIGRQNNGEHDEVVNRLASSGYFHTLGAQILRGRDFRPDEDAQKPRVAIINRTMAKLYFKGEDPIGQRVAWDNDLNKPMEIVGIVNDLQEGQLDAAPRGAMYVAFNQDPSNGFAVVVRTSQNEQSLLGTLTASIHHIDPSIAISDVETMSERIHDSPSAYLHRTSAYLVGWFAAIALVLGVVGLYGVISYSVAQRTREIGVRMALGAPRGAVYGLILKEAGRLTLIGLALGLVSSLGAATLMRKLLFGTEAWDAGTLASVAVVLAGAAMLASYIPARRAARVDPADALRAE